MSKPIVSYSIFFLSLGALAAPAVADENIPKGISPLNVEPDRNGVNLSTGKLNVGIPALSAPADPRLSFDKVQNAAPSVVGNITNNSTGDYMSSSWTVHYGAQSSESFKCRFDDVCNSVKGSGSIFYMPSNFVRAGSGEQYAFSNLASKGAGSAQSSSEMYYAQSVAYPDGEVIQFTYDTATLTSYPSCLPYAVDGCRTYYRPTRLSSNTGYYITIAYDPALTLASLYWAKPIEAKLYSPTNILIRRLVYATDGSITDYGNSATNVGGRTYSTAGVGQSLPDDVESGAASLKLPSEASNTLTLNPNASYPVISSLVRDGVTWNYAYTNISQDITTGNIVWTGMTVTGPDGYRMVYATSSSLTISNQINTATDALGRTTSYGYDTNNRVNHIVFPEGNSVDLVYAGNGQIITKTSHAKPGSGIADVVETLDYNGKLNSCADLGNPVLCYRPTTYTDGLGRVTNYTYNSSGQLSQELAPADANGVRRQTNITYATSPAGISRKTVVRVCGGTSCTGSAESRTEYTYLNNTVLPLTVTQKDEATAATRVTTYTYDDAGRVLSIDGPLAGTGDAKYFQYDKFGRKIWEVAELAPNNLRLAKKFTYRDSDDKVTLIESGTVACTTSCSTASLTLTIQQAVDTTYDARRYVIREKAYKGTTTYSVTDRSFLDRGLAECITVRMNLASLPSATAHGACTLGTQGSQGADRITKNSYDANGQLRLVQKGFGSPSQADYATYSYTANGKQEYVTDANGNAARFQYDGFDRLYRWYFPSKGTPGSYNSVDYEQYAYDAAGNRTSLRKRDGSTLTFTYDNLNRVLSKVATAVVDAGLGDVPVAAGGAGGGGGGGGGGGLGDQCNPICP
jgi:YD repeat-containing protein